MEMIPYGRHCVDEADIEAVCQQLKNGWLTQGTKVTEFEAALARRCGAKHGVACSSGTAGLHLALAAAGLGPENEAVVPAITFLATANAVLYQGARPRFADVDSESALMTPDSLSPHINERTRAVMPVHFAGRACDMPGICSLVRRRAPSAVIVEDACHALGGTHEDGSPVGNLKHSDMAVFSFHPVKHIATGEGGMVLTNSDTFAQRMRELRSHGVTKNVQALHRPDEGPWYYEMQQLGFNYRIPDLNCALGLSQLEKLDAFVARRKEIAWQYSSAWANLPGVTVPDRTPEDRSAWHIYCLRMDFAELGTSRTRFMQALKGRGVGSQVHYFPVPRQPFYQAILGYGENDFPGAEAHYNRTLSVPLFPAMTDADVEHVITAVRKVVEDFTRTMRSRRRRGLGS